MYPIKRVELSLYVSVNQSLKFSGFVNVNHQPNNSPYLLPHHHNRQLSPFFLQIPFFSSVSCMHTLTSFPLLSLLCLSLSVDAIKIPFTVRHLSARDPPSTTKRNIPIINTSNAQYSSNMTIQGVELPILLDTGRSVQHAPFRSSVQKTLPPTARHTLVPISGFIFQIQYQIQRTLARLQKSTMLLDRPEVSSSMLHCLLHSPNTPSIYLCCCLGKIRLATITMDNFTIQDQAYRTSYYFSSPGTLF